MKNEVVIESPQATLKGILIVPAQATGIVLFAHGSGSGRMSPRNQFVAAVLQKGGMATLLLDLLQESEADDRSKVFDIDLLTDRLLMATDWLRKNPSLAKLKVGYFGASTGAAAALQAAARRPAGTAAVVSRGGRPDLAGSWLREVCAPTLLIVGGHDSGVIDLNQEAFKELLCEKDLVIVPRATHLFEESGTLEQVASLASHWFQDHFRETTAFSESTEISIGASP